MNEHPGPFGFRPAVGAELPIVVSIPHTGTYLPEDMAARLASPALRSHPMTDWHLHLLYDFLPRLGIDTLHATVSRFVIDLNRAPDARALYPGRFETTLVPLETFQGERVWATPPSVEEIAVRRSAYYEPYHKELERLVRTKRDRFGRCYLIDVHSVASRANRLHGALVDDVYLGDRDGLSCDAALVQLMREAFEQQGLHVRLNDPYKGGFITDHYGRIDGVQALQIEMCQRLYMDEDGPPGAGPSHPGFAAMQTKLHAVFERLAAGVAAHDACRC